ncbi:MAG TPA: hypothetical protein VNW04_12460 [Puia sp.]|jgi:hypothetical protein|nr:hypothetical protein [Puia sp.]
MKSPVPVLMLYDPEEFWEQVRATVREEIAQARIQTTALPLALEKAGLPIKPAYTLNEIRQLFQLTKPVLNNWIRQGLLKPVPLGRQAYLLYSDLLPLFQPGPDKT